jgi:nucleotide-binding universal stress UspA family protein
MYDTILIPVDGSTHSKRAAEHGLGLARRFGGDAHLLTVVDIQAAAGPFDAGGVDDSFVGRLESDGQARLEEVQADLETEGLALETAVLRGSPARMIKEYADDHDGSLLVMGTQGRTGLERYVVGSVTERVVRSADPPVLTVRAADEPEDRAVTDYDEILVATDGSDHAAAAVEHAVDIAGQFDARIHAVNVVDVAAIAQSPSVTVPTDLVETLASAGEEATADVASTAREAGLAATTTVRKGSPRDELLAYADENDIGLIVMGTAGRTGLDRYLLGSTTEGVLRRAKAPVLAVRAGE